MTPHQPHYFTFTNRKKQTVKQKSKIQNLKCQYRNNKYTRKERKYTNTKNMKQNTYEKLKYPKHNLKIKIKLN